MANKATLEIVAVAEGARASVSGPSADPRAFDPSQAAQEAAKANALAKAFSAAVENQKKLDPAKFENLEGIKFTRKVGNRQFKFAYKTPEEEGAGKTPAPSPPKPTQLFDKFLGKFDNIADSLKNMTGGKFFGNLLGDVSKKLKTSFDKEGMLKQGAESKFSPKNLLSDIGGSVGGALFGPVGAALGKFIPVIGAALGAVKLFSAGISRATEAAMQFSQEAIQAQAQQDIDLIRNSFKIAQENGGSVASVIQAQTEFEKAFQDFGSKLYEFFAPIMEVLLYIGESLLYVATKILEGLVAVKDFIEGVVETFTTWAADNLAWIPGIGGLMKRFDAWMKSDNESKSQTFDMQDTVDDIFGITRLSERTTSGGAKTPPRGKGRGTR